VAKQALLLDLANALLLVLSHGVASRMNWKPATLHKSLYEIVWRTPTESFSRVQEWLVRVMRLLVVLLRDLTKGQLNLRAMGLVYTTLLSIVPLLAISFSVLKAFGVYNQIEPILLGFLEPLGEQGVEITSNVMQFINNINVGVLGSVGLALLLYTAVSLVQKVEEAFNFIWHVTRARSFGERFSRYVSALLVGPLLVFSAIGITAAVASLDVVRDAMEIEAIGWIVLRVGRLVPYALVIGAFIFSYSFIPNTKVRLAPAIIGGVVGGIAWQTAGWGFAQFAASSTKYASIYSSFAIVILFMLWLYLSWLVLLLGSSVAFYVQHPAYLVEQGGEPRLSNRMRERLALVIMSLIGRNHLDGRSPWSADALARFLSIPTRAIDELLVALQARNILTTTGDEPPGWLPVRDLDNVSANELLDTVRTAGEEQYLNTQALPVSEAVEQVLRRYDDATDAALRGVTVKDLAGTLPDEPSTSS
jgi:membrane protein